MGRLRELESVHARATGLRRGRRWGTEQLNRSLFLLLVAQFQTYCRDLHDEAVAVHMARAAPAQVLLLGQLMSQGRTLDVGNPRRSALGTDFSRVGIPLIPDLTALGPGVVNDLDALDHLVDFRNAISHGNETQVQALIASGRIRATKRSYLEHRRAVDRLAGTVDSTVATGLAAVLGIGVPW